MRTEQVILSLLQWLAKLKIQIFKFKLVFEWQLQRQTDRCACCLYVVYKRLVESQDERFPPDWLVSTPD